ncbi:unnamed protein product [Ranitomeya imitator]|uniref:Kinesin motor domain-containing protein n=1 Tax=Ranitomeya imitator TaxID=111125 RepID=A0ABN9MDH0_9NEOB|nr:unnamed protein product [Ranitomeya imitator]
MQDQCNVNCLFLQGSEMSAGSSDVQVFVRFRPTPHFAQDVISVDADSKAVDIHLRKDDKFGVVNNKRYDWSFKVDGVLHDASQASVYHAVAKSVVTQGLQGYNGTIMCYGQTGAGKKTYTITGATENYKNRGVIPRALQQVFKEIDEQSDRTVTVRISYLEIYNETLFDLLSTMPDVPASGPQMAIVDEPQGVSVKGLSLHHAADEEHALNLLFEVRRHDACVCDHVLDYRMLKCRLSAFTHHVDALHGVCCSTGHYVTVSLYSRQARPTGSSGHTP